LRLLSGVFGPDSSMVFTFNGSLILPPIAPSAAITVPFTFTDTFTHLRTAASS
jgi:hypothetical protein